MFKHVLSLSLLVCVPTVYAQSKPSSIEAAQLQHKALGATVPPIDAVGQDPHLTLERAQIANTVHERQIALRRDTEKLLALAAELKVNVDKTGPNILSVDVIKKAQEIEKLAKSVKDKMKDAF